MTPVKRPLALFSAAIAPLLLSACASTGEYPSLAQRPAERAEGTFTPDTSAPTAEAPVVTNADLAQRLAALQAEARTLHAEFVAAAPAAERLAAASGERGSDSWASAEVALADLDALRSRVAVALAELDVLLIDSTVEAGPREAIANAHAAVESIVTQEDAVLARLRGRI